MANAYTCLKRNNDIATRSNERKLQLQSFVIPKMGQINSVFGSAGNYSKVYQSYSSVRCWQSRFELLQLTEYEVGQLFEIFNIATEKEGNTINTMQLAAYLKIDFNLFALKMFSSLKENIKFESFVFEVWNICTVEERDLGKMTV